MGKNMKRNGIFVITFLLILFTGCAKNKSTVSSDKGLDIEVLYSEETNEIAHLKADIINEKNISFSIDADVTVYDELFYGKADPIVPDAKVVADVITGRADSKIIYDYDESAKANLYTIESNNSSFQYIYRTNSNDKENTSNDLFVINASEDPAGDISDEDAVGENSEYSDVINRMINDSSELYDKLFGTHVIADRDYVLRAKGESYLYKTSFYNTLEGVPVVDLEGFLEIYIYLCNDQPVYIYPNRKTPYVFTEKTKCRNIITAEDAVRKLCALFSDGKVESPPYGINLISNAYYVSDGLCKDKGEVIPVWVFGYYESPSHRSIWYALDARNGELIFDYHTFGDIFSIEY